MMMAKGRNPTRKFLSDVKAKRFDEAFRAYERILILVLKTIFSAGFFPFPPFFFFSVFQMMADEVFFNRRAAQYRKWCGTFRRRTCVHVRGIRENIGKRMGAFSTPILRDVNFSVLSTTS